MAMIRDRVLDLLRDRKQDLTHYHVKALYLFGSVARGEESLDSDVDILVSFLDQTTFDQYMDLKFYLEDLFQRKIDLVTEAGLRPEIKKYLEEDLIRAAWLSALHQRH